MNSECLETFYLIMGRRFISNEEFAIVQRTCRVTLNCSKCRYYREGSVKK